MGYDVHITRKTDWFDDEPAIPLEEWLSTVAADPEMRLDGYAEALLPSGDTLRVESEGLAVWTAYSRAGVGGGQAWFDYQDGNVVVKDPDREIRAKMWRLAQTLQAKVQGDEDEVYDARGANTSAKKAWWQWWRR
jgi:hypothetical protein